LHGAKKSKRHDAPDNMCILVYTWFVPVFLNSISFCCKSGKLKSRLVEC